MSESMTVEERNAIINASKEFVDASVIRANDKIKKIAKEDGYISFADAVKIMRAELGLGTSYADDNLIDPPGWGYKKKQEDI